MTLQTKHAPMILEKEMKQIRILSILFIAHLWEVLRRPIVCVCRVLLRLWLGGWRMVLCSVLSEETLPFLGLRIDLI